MSDLEDEVVEVVEEDDLEEGEITDTDSDIEIVMSNFKSKKLPKRYSLHEKKVSKDKHKNNCKHAHHSNYKVRDRNKSPISNGTHKKHKSSCLQHQKYSKTIESSGKVSPNCLDNRNITKSAFKNFSSPPRPVLPKTSPSNKHEFKNEDDDEDNYSELLLAYKKCRQHLKSKKKSSVLSSSEPKPPSKISSKRSSYDHHSSSKSNKYHIPNERTSPLRNEARLPFKENNSNISKKNNSPVEKLPVPETVQAQTVGEALTPIEVEQEEESEDEEELRRIALATFAQRSLAKQKATENDISAINSPTHSISNQSSAELYSNVDSSNDNHNVVDMDVDEEDFVEDIHNNLFVIDNNPVASSEFNPYFYDESHANHGNSTAQDYLPPEQELSFPASFNQMNEEAEEAILRAEVIASMYKKRPVPSPIEDKSPKIEDLVESPSPHDMLNEIPVITKGRLFKSSDINNSNHNKRLPHSSIKDMVESLSPQDPYNKITVHSNGQLLRSSKENINTEFAKLGPQLVNSKKIPAAKPRNINATQNRLIITLNNDSSSEESDNDEISDSKQNNVVSSIDALISDARLKSDIKANSANLNNVSCLSKAQQEEYKKLRNLLAEKEPLTILPQVVKEKIAAEHQNLNFLTTKISLAKKKLDKEALVFQSAEKEVVDKKKIYLSAKLKFQHLQEQLHAAKLNKVSTLKAWKVHEAKLGNAKSVVTKQKALIALLETEYNHRRLQFEQNSSSPLIQ